MRNYHEFLALDQSHTTVNRWLGLHTERLSAGKIVDVWTDNYDRAWYYENGLVRIFPQEYRNSCHDDTPRESWPESIKHYILVGPRKEYAVVTGLDTVKRYYVLPPFLNYYGDKTVTGKAEGGLLFTPHPDKAYVPAYPIQDYEITVDRSAKKKAMAKWKPLFDYADAMWQLLPAKMDEETRVRLAVDSANAPLNHKKRETWHAHVARHRTLENGRQTLHAAIDKHVMVTDLPYAIVPIPNTRTSHTSHWKHDLIDCLRKAGRLEDLPEPEE